MPGVLVHVQKPSEVTVTRVVSVVSWQPNKKVPVQHTITAI